MSNLVRTSHEQRSAASDLAAQMHAKRLQSFLRGRREYLGVSQEELASRLRITPRAYGNWERGRVKEWTEEKLHALAAALEMNEFQTVRLFWIAVELAPQPSMKTTAGQEVSEDASVADFLNDYKTMMGALSLPTFLIDQRWDIKMANTAYHDLFRSVRTQSTSSPTKNFLCFGLFHPDASKFLVNYSAWQMAMLTQLSSNIERYDQDLRLHAIRREVYRHPALRHAYVNEISDWIHGQGTDLVHESGVLRKLRHPDPQVGVANCRFVEETPRSLRTIGLTRITLVFSECCNRTEPEQSRQRHAA